MQSKLAFVILSLLATGPLSGASSVPKQPRASPSPCDTAYVCPATDDAGFPYAPYPPGDANAGPGNISCSYPVIPGTEDDFYCVYNKQTGALVQDQNAGFCPGTATANPQCSTRRVKRSLPTRPRVLGVEGSRSATKVAMKRFTKNSQVENSSDEQASSD